MPKSESVSFWSSDSSPTRVAIPTRSRSHDSSRWGRFRNSGDTKNIDDINKYVEEHGYHQQSTKISNYYKNSIYVLSLMRNNFLHENYLLNWHFLFKIIEKHEIFRVLDSSLQVKRLQNLVSKKVLLTSPLRKKDTQWWD